MNRALTLFLGGLLVLGFLLGCGGDDDDDNPVDPSQTQSYTLTAHDVFTTAPNMVNIFFQTTHAITGMGVRDLRTSDFQVLENGQPISQYESSMRVEDSNEINYTLKTVLMLDNSTSVGENLAQIKSAAVGMVSGITPVQQFAIATFSDGVQMVQGFTNDEGTLQAAINGIELGAASTDLYGAAIEGAGLWENEYILDDITQGFLVMMTDGRDTQFAHTLQEALTAIDDKQVYTVGVGPETDASALDQLGTAESFSIENFGELEATFASIQERLELYANSFYYLHYQSPTRGQNTHELTLELVENINTGEDATILSSFSSTLFFSPGDGTGEVVRYEDVALRTGSGDDVEGIFFANGTDGLTSTGASTIQFKNLGEADLSFFNTVDNDDGIQYLTQDWPTGYTASTGIGHENTAFAVVKYQQGDPSSTRRGLLFIETMTGSLAFVHLIMQP